MSWETFIFYVIGIVVGSIATFILSRIHTKKGTLRIDHSDSEKDIYRFDLDGVCDKKTKKFILKVDHNAHLSQD